MSSFFIFRFLQLFYFLTFSQHVGKLLKAYDIEIVELAVSVIFYACLPSTSLTTSPLEADWKEGVEVSKYAEHIV